MNNTVIVKSARGKLETLTLPEVPAGFKNGKKCLAVLKRYIKKRKDDAKACKDAIAHLESIFNAPKITDLKFESYFKGYTCHAEVWICTASGYYKRSTGRAGGGGYDKTSSAVYSGIRNNENFPSFERYLIENCTKILKSGRNYPFKANGFEDKNSIWLPDYDLGGCGIDCLDKLARNMKWRGEVIYLHDGAKYGEFVIC